MQTSLASATGVSPWVSTGNRAAYPDAYGSGLGVTEYEPAGKAAEEMRALWTWILHRMEKTL
jgi:chromosome partitioning protein